MFLSTDWVNAAMKAGRGIRMGLVVRVGCARWGMFMSDLRDVKRILRRRRWGPPFYGDFSLRKDGKG